MSRHSCLGRHSGNNIACSNDVSAWCINLAWAFHGHLRLEPTVASTNSFHETAPRRKLATQLVAQLLILAVAQTSPAFCSFWPLHQPFVPISTHQDRIARHGDR